MPAEDNRTYAERLWDACDFDDFSCELTIKENFRRLLNVLAGEIEDTNAYIDEMHP